jgi:Flp pilus assembly protein TadD
MKVNPPRIEEAVRFYTAAVALQPESSRLSTSLGIALRKLNRPEEAKAEFLRACQIAPDKAAAQFGLGSEFITAGFIPEAVEELREAARLAPEDAAVHNNLGLALHKSGRFPEAIVEYHEAIRLAPRHALFHNNLGRALFAQKNVKEAIAEFSMAVQLQGHFEQARENLELAMRTLVRPLRSSDAPGQGSEREAGLAFDDVSASRPSNNRLRGMTLAAGVEGFVTNFVNGLENRDFDVAMANLYRHGNWERAIQAFKDDEVANSGGTTADWFFLAMAHWQLGHKDEARQWYDKAVAKMDATRSPAEWLLLLRTEASELLGIEVKKK